jgi:hypothetical protein
VAIRTAGIVLGVGLALAVLSLITAVPLAPIIVAVVLALGVLWLIS